MYFKEDVNKILIFIMLNTNSCSRNICDLREATGQLPKQAPPRGIVRHAEY